MTNDHLKIGAELSSMEAKAMEKSLLISKDELLVASKGKQFDIDQGSIFYELASLGSIILCCVVLCCR